MHGQLVMRAHSTTLGELARAHPNATRVFLRHRLDYCCGGRRTLAEACETLGLDPAMIADELEAEAQAGTTIARWDARPRGELADFIECRYHAALRRDLPGLIASARGVERDHGDAASAPRGLADVLAELSAELEPHMTHEERVLFPQIRDGVPVEAIAVPLAAMAAEHDIQRDFLAQIRELTHDLRAPARAPAPWVALYRALETLEADLTQHIHLENNILFARGEGDPRPRM